MNRIGILLMLSFLTVSCVGKHQSEAQKIIVSDATEHLDIEADTLKMNVAKSKIDWVATEMRGTKRRTGRILFKDGYFLTTNNEIVGGKFTVDMETMDVTDVPIQEKIARKNLLDHLKSDDFFNVAHYPQSTLEIKSVEKLNSGLLKISGNLSIREVKKNIEFFAQQNNKYFSTRFALNRLDWNIAYKGSWADKTLVDKEIELKINIALLRGSTG